MMKKALFAVSILVALALLYPMAAIGQKVGDNGPAGGLIFYDKGNNNAGWRYLEAAPNDQSTGVPWYDGKILTTGAIASAVGTGQVNTMAIVDAYGAGTYAAGICIDLNQGGYDDWFLPSKDELDLMYQNLKAAGLGGFAPEMYWSSSEYNDGMGGGAYAQDFADGRPDGRGKSGGNRVRAVRAFFTEGP